MTNFWGYFLKSFDKSDRCNKYIHYVDIIDRNMKTLQGKSLPLKRFSMQFSIHS